MKRLEVLDVCRSFCVMIMVLYHALYDLILLEQLPPTVLDNTFMDVLAYGTAGAFVLLGGVTARFCRDVLRRGFRLFCLGLAVSVIAALAGQPIAFGVLQLFGLCMMGYGLLRRRLDKAGKWLPLSCAVLFVLSTLLTERIHVPVPWLYPLGLRTESFYSADYFPLLPWAFLFLMGTWLGGWVINARQRRCFTRRYPRWLCFCGRNSLRIYLFHQPLLFTLFSLLFR